MGNGFFVTECFLTFLYSQNDFFVFLIEGRGVALPIVLYILLLGTNCSLSSTDVDGVNAKNPAFLSNFKVDGI